MWKPESKKNVLQKIWKPESTNTAIVWNILESRERSANIFYLIWKMCCKESGSRRVRKMSCKKSGSRRVLVQQLCWAFWNRKKDPWISSIWFEKCPAKKLVAVKKPFGVAAASAGGRAGAIMNPHTEYWILQADLGAIPSPNLGPGVLHRK